MEGTCNFHVIVGQMAAELRSAGIHGNIVRAIQYLNSLNRWHFKTVDTFVERAIASAEATP